MEGRAKDAVLEKDNPPLFPPRRQNRSIIPAPILRGTYLAKRCAH